MELRYMGFDQTQNKRTYKFDRLVKGEPLARFLVSADMALFLRHHVGIQEGPALCARKLTSDLECSAEAAHELTSDDLLAYVSARTEAEARKAALRKTWSGRRAQSQS
jgi:hypothetical protein